MKACQLNTQITVERPSTTTEEDFGTETVIWLPLSTIGSPPVTERFWAEVQDVMPSRSEAVREGLKLARNLTRIRLRYRNDIDSTMRIKVHRDTDVLYQIVGGPAEIGGRRRFIELLCERFSTDPNGN